MKHKNYWQGDYHINFCNSRFNHLKKYLKKDELKGKKILELGCGWGYLGELLEKEGASVVSVDAREENIKAVKKYYPNRKVYILDVMDNLEKLGKFDAIFCFGLLYHLEKPEEFLKKCSKISDVIYLSTVINEDSYITWIEKDNAFNQSITGHGCEPSTDFIMNKLKSLEYNVQNITEDGSWSLHLKRAMFIAKKTINGGK